MYESKELVLMVEGEGDTKAASNLISRMLSRLFEVPPLFLGQPMKVGDIYALLAPSKEKNNETQTKLVRFLGSAQKRKNLGAVLILLDGDAKVQRPISTTEGRKNFCPAEIGQFITEQAMQKTRAGQTYSLAVVFANQEFESWILAGHPVLSKQTEGENLESYPRNAKKRIKEITAQPYNEAADQLNLTREIDIDQLLQREPEMRSFRRFENAIRQIGTAIINESPICSPVLATPSDSG